MKKTPFHYKESRTLYMYYGDNLPKEAFEIVAIAPDNLDEKEKIAQESEKLLKKHHYQKNGNNW